MVRNILGMVGGGYSIDRILESYPDLSREDVIAALEYAAESCRRAASLAPCIIRLVKGGLIKHEPVVCQLVKRY